MTWRAGGACPLEDCNFQFIIAADSENEVDIVGAAVMDAHSAYAHDGMPVSLFGVAADPDTLMQDDDDEERPRLVN